VEIVDPRVVEQDQQYVVALDDLLQRHGWQDTKSVANTIFPSDLARTSRSRDRLYARYLRLHDGLRRASKKNSKGLYFERLIRYPLQTDEARANQLETIIQALQGARRPGGLYHAYELQIFSPGKDLRPMGFPCLSSLSAHVDGDRLRLSATYRNQYYIQKALGNFIGLAGLQRFIADHAGLKPGALSIHAFHAQIDPGVGAGELAALMASMPTLQSEET
jgi:thymidylate synthase